ncbi:serine/arginine repetitive matrix protein 1-like [Rattus norvegicus]|uniref:serine/arginine repetitive matrix protein 1-like n=1 Tax=Rattus norvegicus TaxID=10116 RepID=UPI002FD7E1E3
MPESRSLSELTRQIAPPTKNGHAPPPTESRKSYQSVNPVRVRAGFSFATILPPEPKDFGFPEAARRVMGITPPHRQSASFMVGTTTSGKRGAGRTGGGRRGQNREGHPSEPSDTPVPRRREDDTLPTRGPRRGPYRARPRRRMPPGLTGGRGPQRAHPQSTRASEAQRRGDGETTPDPLGRGRRTVNRREGDHANGERRETGRRPTPGEKRRMRTGPMPDTRRRRPRADRWRRRGGGRRATLTPRGGREGGRARVGREAGPRGSEGERHRPEPPPPHRDAHTEDGGAGRAPAQTHPQPTGPTDRRGRQPLKPLSPLRLAGRLSPRTRLQETRRDAPPRPRRPGRPSNRNFLPPAGRPFPPGTPRPPRDPCAPGCPPVRRGPAARPRVGQTRSERERNAGGRGGGANRQNEDRRRQGGPQRHPPRETPHKGPGGRSGGDRAREPSRRESHCTQPGAVPPRPRHRADPKPTDNPREPEETPADARENRGRRRRQPTKTPAWQRVPTSDDAPDAADRRFPQIRSPPPRARPTPRFTDPREPRGGGRGGRTAPAISTGRGNAAVEGGDEAATADAREHAARTTRDTTSPREWPGRGRAWEGRTRDGGHGGNGGGWDREPTAALPNPPVPRRPLAVRGVPRTRACARPFPATCHQKPNLPHKLRTAAGRQSPVPRDPSSYSERGGAGRGRRESKRCAQKAEVRAGSRGDHPGEAPRRS